MPRRRFRLILTALLLAGFGLRYVLAFRVFPAQGFAWDLSTFADWMETIRANGSAAYAVDPSINYPPVFAQLLEFLNWLGMHRSGTDSPETGAGPWLLLKWLPVLADLGIAALLAHAGRRWFSADRGLWAAGLYLFIPVTWYDSAIWGQMDSVAALPMLAALILLADRRPELASIAFVAGVLIKPQAALSALVLVPALIGLARHRKLSWWRCLSTVTAALAGFAVMVNSWSLQVYVSDSTTNIPLLGNISGLAHQYLATADLFPYLSVNTYNPWALAHLPSLASQFPNGDVTWVVDGYRVLGINSHLLGLCLFAVAVAVAWWLVLRRSDGGAILLASAVVLTGFFVLTTRVHERYLVQAFAVLALVWAHRWWQRVALIVLALLNTANLHAILVGGIRITTDLLGQDLPPNPYPHNGMPPEFYGLGWPGLPVLGATNHVVILAAIAAATLALLLLIWQAVRLGLDGGNDPNRLVRS